MRSASTVLIAALAARASLWSADLFTLTLTNTQVYRWTSADQPISYGGHVWSSVGPTIDRSSWGAKNTTEVPELVIKLYSGGSDFGAGNNIKALAHAGLFDGAYMLLQRAFMPQFGNTSLGLVTLFGGLVGQIEINALGINMTCTASNVQLEQNLPRRTYQASCMHTLYDAQCTLNIAAYTTSYVVSAASALNINWTTAPSGDPTRFVYGTMTLTSGAGAGQALTVAYAASAGVAFGYPLLTIPAPGDTFTLSEGCAKTVARCQSFGNILNFGGMPYIPAQSSGL